jgi:son of sevenless-like protein
MLDIPIQNSDTRGKVTVNTSTINLPLPILPKMSKTLKLFDIDPLELARQLTIIESRLYLSIKPIECLERSREIKVDNKDNISHAIQHFNQVHLDNFSIYCLQTLTTIIAACKLGSRPHTGAGGL